MDTQPTDLQSFHNFVSRQLASGRGDLLPEDCVELWRATNLACGDLQASVKELEESIADLNAGRLLDFDAVNELIRKRHG